MSNVPSKHASIADQLRDPVLWQHDNTQLRSDAADEIERQARWAKEWHRLVESIATTLNVNSAGGLVELSIGITDAINALRRSSSDPVTAALSPEPHQHVYDVRNPDVCESSGHGTCSTCGGSGEIDETLGGIPTSNPRAPCPDCSHETGINSDG